MLTETELKEKLINTISNTHNEELLQQLSRLIDLEDQSEEIYHLSQAEINAVTEGINQIADGNFLTHEEANKQVEEWLKK
jgi:predicted transcriptional regulator